jgi:hypothetical protein
MPGNAIRTLQRSVWSRYAALTLNTVTGLYEKKTSGAVPASECFPTEDNKDGWNSVDRGDAENQEALGGAGALHLRTDPDAMPILQSRRWDPVYQSEAVSEWSQA